MKGNIQIYCKVTNCIKGRRDRIRMVIGITTTHAISWEFESHLSHNGVLDTTLCDQVC